MKFSLVLATINRTHELQRFLATLDRQAYRDFELILVDQNPCGYLDALLQPFHGRFPLYRLFTKPGLSAARSLGLEHIRGDIVGFPDDDCWYPENLLSQVNSTFEENPGWSGISGVAIDEKGKKSSSSWSRFPGFLTFWNIWTRGIAFAFFLKKEVITQVGDFDETLGPGTKTPWGSGEEADYLIRAVKSGAKIYYQPDIKVYHRQVVSDYNERELKRALRYGMGMGHVLQKHAYPKWYVAYRIFRGCFAAFWAYCQRDVPKANFHWDSAKGRWYGWRGKF